MFARQLRQAGGRGNAVAGGVSCIVIIMPGRSEQFDIPTEPIHRLTVEQYDRMARSGILTAADQVELLEGWLVEKMTKNPPHRIATRRVRLALEAVVPPEWYVDTQEPIRTGDSEPEPDVAVSRGATEDYTEANPPAENVGLIVEIADATLLRDRQLKARVYARAGVPHYWILNLIDARLETHADPSGPGATPSYRTRTVYDSNNAAPLILDDAEIARLRVADLLP